MTQRLDHSPARILRQAMVDMSLGAEPSGNNAVWPVYANKEVDLPDNLIVVKNTSPLAQGNSQITGEFYEFYGIQLVFRGKDSDTAYLKANAVLNSLCTVLYARYVTIDAKTYCVHCFNKEGGIIDVGYDNPTTKRQMFTVNGLCPINEIA